MAINRVQTAYGAASASSGPTVTFSAAAAGNLLVAVITASQASGARTLSGVTAGWTLVPTDGDVTGGSGNVHHWVYWKIAAGGETGFAGTLSNALDDWTCCFAEYHDSLGGVWEVDRSAHSSGTGTTVDSGTTSVTHHAVEVWLGFLSNRRQAMSSPTNGFAEAVQTQSNAGTSEATGGIYEKIVAGTGDADVSATLASSDNWAGTITTFYPAVSSLSASPSASLSASPSASPSSSPSASPSASTSASPSVSESASASASASASTSLSPSPSASESASPSLSQSPSASTSPSSSESASPSLSPSTSGSESASPSASESPSSSTSASPSPSPEPITFTYQWQQQCATYPGPCIYPGPYTYPGEGLWGDIVGATDECYIPTLADVGCWLRLQVTADNGFCQVTVATNISECPVLPRTVRPYVPGSTLGCGHYEVAILTRGGSELVTILPWTQLEWGRVLDDTSTATVVGSAGQDADCCAALAAVRPWRHEIAVYRDGALVWVGPIYDIRTPAGSFRIQARDLTAWWDRRRVHNDIDLPETDLATIFQAISDDAMAPDDSPGIVLSTSACGIRGSRRILATQHRVAGQELRDLTNTGIDWTAIGRTVLAGGLVVPTSPLGTFVDEHFANPPTPIRDGSEQANSRTIRGAGGGEMGDTIYATAVDGTAARDDGLLEAVDSISTITDYNSVQQAADSRLALTTYVEAVEECALAPTAPFTAAQLVPGALCNLNLQETCLPVVGSYRLKSVRVSVDAGQDDSFQLMFQPLGTE